MQQILLGLGAILTILGSTIYITSIIRGRTVPHRVTRFVLFFILGLNFVSVLAAHGNLGAQLYGGIIFLYGAAFFLLSIKHGVGGTTWFDRVCLTIAVTGIIGWQITGNAKLSVCLAALADIIAYIPAFVKTWQRPGTESPWLYILSGFGALLSLVAYPLTLVSIFQIAALSCGLVMLICIYHTPIKLRIG